MSRIKILYITSTLRNSGPTNQLFNLIKYLDLDTFEVQILTLSPEPVSDSRIEKFMELHVTIKSLKLSRLKGFLYAKKLLLLEVNKFDPTIIHTQGIRADIIVSKFKGSKWKHIITIHNNPNIDYNLKYGKFLGKVMAIGQMKAFNSCDHLISCSKSLSTELSKNGIQSGYIQNGVEINVNPNKIINQFERPLFVVVGSLIPRKNVGYVIEAFNIYSDQKRGSLLILGNGPEQNNLKSKAKSKNIIFLGKVSNVHDYLAIADVYVSASLGEGLPLTALEAMSLKLPLLLSNIPAHIEISEKAEVGCNIFNINDQPTELSNILLNYSEFSNLEMKEGIYNIVKKYFSAESMSKKYQDYYLKVI